MPASPDDGAVYAARVTDVIVELELFLLRQLATEMRTGRDGSWERDALAALQRWRAAADRGVAGARERLVETVTTVLLAARADGQALALGDLADADVDPGRPRSPAEVVRRAEELARQLMGALEQTPRLLQQVYLDAVAAGAAEAAGGKVTRLQAAQHVLDRLGAQGVTGYRDRGGRNWSLSSYVEMAVRTEAGHQAVQGHVDALLDAGLSLVQVSDSPRECPLCRPWEGKVLSLTGFRGEAILPGMVNGTTVRVTVHGTLDEARAAGFQHPNCRHSVSAYLPGATPKLRPVSDPAGYEAGQRQRAIERRIREWKRREAVALDDAAVRVASAKVRAWQQELREHVEASGLKRLRRREQINVAT